MLLAEDLLLLLVDDATGKPLTDGTKLDHAIAGAVLLELALQGKVDVTATREENRRKGRLVVRDPSPTGEAILDEALTLVADKQGKKPESVIGALKKGLRERLLSGLAERGILRREEGKILGIFPTTKWGAEDSRHEDALRSRLRGVLVSGLTPDNRSGALISLLSAIDVVPKIVESPDRRAVKRRAKEVAEGAWAADAVRRAVEAVNAATVAATTAATSGSGG
ncbi:MAG: GOLPH3/VPS74 family protein [Actinopolymorphaceae bacterium]